MPNGYYFFPGDYLRDTTHLGWYEDLAYRRLIDLYYVTGKPLRNDRTYLLRAVRAAEPEQQAAVDAVLAEFFDLQADGWHNMRCDERLRVENARSEGGKRGAEARWHGIKHLGHGKPLARQWQANAPFPSLPFPTRKKKEGARFAAPALAQVQAYIASKGYGVDAEKWHAHYTANGWKVGRNPMKNWEAAVRTWARDDPSPASEPARGCLKCAGSLTGGNVGGVCFDCYYAKEER